MYSLLLLKNIVWKIDFIYLGSFTLLVVWDSEWYYYSTNADVKNKFNKLAPILHRSYSLLLTLPSLLEYRSPPPMPQLVRYANYFYFYIIVSIYFLLLLRSCKRWIRLVKFATGLFVYRSSFSSYPSSPPSYDSATCAPLHSSSDSNIIVVICFFFKSPHSAVQP